jgi:hypothetical protein
VEKFLSRSFSCCLLVAAAGVGARERESERVKCVNMREKIAWEMEKESRLTVNYADVDDDCVLWGWSCTCE